MFYIFYRELLLQQNFPICKSKYKGCNFVTTVLIEAMVQLICYFTFPFFVRFLWPYLPRKPMLSFIHNEIDLEQYFYIPQHDEIL